MKNIFHIAFVDIKVMVRDKTYFFWTLVFPLVFILIFGNIFKGGSGPPKAGLAVLNQDTGQWGQYLIEQIKSPDILIDVVDKEPETYNRMLIIPADFSTKIKEKSAQQLLFRKKDGANVKAAKQVEIKIFQGIVKVISQLILHPDTETFFKDKTEFKEIVQIKAQFPEGTLKKVPSGFDHVIPGTLIQFILMMVLIYGGVLVMNDRKHGILTRILFSSASISQLWGGKFLGRLIMGFLQALILIITGMLFFKLNLGNLFLAFLTVLFFSASVASLSILAGSLLSKEDIIVGISILFGNVFAALGGCWWPIEVVPETFRKLAVISPAYWAMDAFHKVIFFNKGMSDVYLNYLVLLGFTMVFSIISIRFFKIKD